MGTDIAKEKSEQIINYYIFHKKIDNLIKKGENPIKSQTNEEYIYILNSQWIKKWKLYSNYDVIKTELDKIIDNDENSLITKLNERCNELINDGTINNSTDYQPGTYDEYSHLDFGNTVLDLQFIKEEVFEYFVDYKTFSSFFGIFEKIFNFNNIINIKGIIKNQMFILMMNQKNKIKLFYKGDLESKIELIQLTAKFSNETDLEKYYQFCKSNLSETIIKDLNEKNVGYIKEVDVGNCIFTNEILNLRYLDKEIKNKSINFQNIRSNFIGLTKIRSPPYLNAVMQNLVNIPSLTKYLLDTSNFTIINQNINFCKFTCFICHALSSLYYDQKVKYSSLNDLDSLIFYRESKFKFDENCIPGDLIKYILETINLELYQLFNNLTQNRNNIYSTIISNTFLCISGNITKCNNCLNEKIEYKNSFLFEFYLDIIYNRYTNTKDMIKKDEKYILTLDLCFKHFSESFDLILDDHPCNNCKMKSKRIINNDLFSLPNILIISVNKESDANDDYIFTFGEELNLKNFVNKNSNSSNYNYQLIGVISHLNKTKEYYSFCKHSLSNKWYKCNDLDINICSNPIKDILNQNIDVLIYESKDGSNNSISIRNVIDEQKDENSFPNKKINNIDNDALEESETNRLLTENNKL